MSRQVLATVPKARSREQVAADHGSGPAVMVADDHPAVAYSLSRWLHDRFRVLEPIIRLEMLEPAVRIARPAVLVADLDFEGVSALPVLKRLLRAVPSTRVVVYSGADTEVARELCLAAGAVNFVAKLDPAEDLLAAISKALPTGPDESTETGSSLTRLPCPVALNRTSHDHGPLITWLLRSGFSQRRIAEAVGGSIKTVEYHSRKGRVPPVISSRIQP